MKKKVILSLFILLLIALPVNAARWDYVLRNYPDSNEQSIVAGYLKEFHENLKNTWYTPLYRRYCLRTVSFDLNRDGTVSNINIIATEEEPAYTLIYFDEHLKAYLSKLRYKPFPACIKENTIKMGYNFSGNFTPYYLFAGYGALVFYKGDEVFEYAEKINLKY